MATKVRRGLGLLVVAVLAFVALNVTVRLMYAAESDALGLPMFAVSLVLMAGMIVGAVGGLAMVAWGLLRD